ncbi:unnamed protein product [Ophioblennius macclurei]
MAASSVQGNWKHFRIPPAEGSPESSLTWCLAHIHKPAPPPAAGTEHPGHEPRGGRGDTDGKRLRVSQWKALVAIRTQHIKGDKAGIARFRSQGGLRPLLELVRQPQCSRKTLDVALSILGNCCTEAETRVEVRKLDGINILVDVLKRSVALDTVQNRAARALGNLAMDPESSSLIHSADGVPPLLLCLSPSPSSPNDAPLKENSPKLECAQSAARALFYLADSHANRLSLVTQGALSALAPLIAPEYPHVLRRAALRSLHELTRGCGVECAREVSRSGVAARLGAVVSAESGAPLEELALKTLANMCLQGCLRPLVGSLGVIHKFTREVKKDPLKSGIFLKALCLCCKEAVNRAKVKESGGLEALIAVMAAHRSHALCRLPIMACVDFFFDEAAMEQLQELGLVPLLVTRLVELAQGGGALTEKMNVNPSSNVSTAELLSSSCFDSFDFPTLENCKKEESGKEQGSNSFLSLRSWLVSEGLITSEEDLLDSSVVEVEWGATHMPTLPSSSPTSPSPQASAIYPYSNASVRNVSSAPPPLGAFSAPKKLSQPPSLLRTDRPTPAARLKMPASPTKFSSSHRKKHRSSTVAARSTKVPTAADALLSSAPPRPATNTDSHPCHPDPWTPESPILLLLSRFSHATDPSAALISSGVMPGLLLYVTQHRDPSVRCIRMLCRLTCNPNCLEALLRTGSVGLFQHFLCQREAAPPRQGEGWQTERAKAKVIQLGSALLNNLRVQCQSAFGSGVVAHVMLSGSEVDRMNCALCLPLISSNKYLLKKLLLDGGGLLLALQPLDCDDDGDDEEGHTADDRTLLSDLLDAPHSDLTAHLPSLYFSLLAECLSALTASLKVDFGKKCPIPPLAAIRPQAGKVLPPPSKRFRLPDSCPYGMATFDLLLLLDDGSRIPASRDAVAWLDGGGAAVGGGVGSEYFRALLRGGFVEARGDAEQEIRIRDVSPGMLLPVLHFLHGCRLAKEEEAEPAGAASGRERCRVLNTLALDGLSVCQAQHSTKDMSFQRMPLGEAMAGACRFLVDELRCELEELCAAMLAAAAEKTSWKVEPDCGESAEENLAIRTSALELTGPEKQTKDGDAYLQQMNDKTVSRPETGLQTKCATAAVSQSKTDGSGSANVASSSFPQCSAMAVALSALLPQVYWFCQQYSFPSLRRACLAVLLGCRDRPRPFCNSSAAGDCLRRLARDADCTDTLKQDVMSLVSGALS